MSSNAPPSPVRHEIPCAKEEEKRGQICIAVDPPPPPEIDRPNLSGHQNLSCIPHLPLPPTPSHPSKSIKKHKQRQGFHTEAGVSAWDGEWQGSHTHGFGACSCCEDRTRLATASPWTAGPLRNASGDPSGVLVSLPWRKWQRRYFLCRPRIFLFLRGPSCVFR